jgi:hypothetical protein
MVIVTDISYGKHVKLQRIKGLFNDGYGLQNIASWIIILTLLYKDFEMEVVDLGDILSWAVFKIGMQFTYILSLFTSYIPFNFTIPSAAWNSPMFEVNTLLKINWALWIYKQ